MHSRAFRLKKLGWVTIRPLAAGDTATIAAVFDRLGPESHARRFSRPQPCLSAAELAMLATVDVRRHALVAYVEGETAPAAFAQLVRDEEQRAQAQISFAVAECYHGRGIGSTLVELLAADARAAGITHLTAAMQCWNGAAYGLVRKVTDRVDVRQRGGEATLVAASAAS